VAVAVPDAKGQNGRQGGHFTDQNG